VLVALASAGLFAMRGHRLGVGDEIDAPITVVPSDRYDLECVLSGPVGAYQCAYVDDDTLANPFPRAKNLVAAYVTTDRTTFLVPGLFEQPAVRSYLAARPGRNDRFLVECKLRLIAFVTAYRLRFKRRDRFGDGDPTWLGEPTQCRVR